MVKRILVALSGTPYTPIAVKWAVELAQRNDASVTGVTVVDTERLTNVGPVPIGGAARARSLGEQRVAITEEHIEEEIAGFEKACRDGSISYMVDRERGDPFELLVELWRYHDLTVIGLRGLFEYGVVTNPDDVIVQLLQHGVRPIFAVSTEYRPVNRVLISYSGTKEAAMAMKRFAQLRPWPEATLKIVSFGFEEEEAMPLLIDSTSYLRAHGYDPEAESLPGTARAGLVPYAAEWGADLIVMGSISRSRIAKLVFGGATEAVITQASVPLFISQ